MEKLIHQETADNIRTHSKYQVRGIHLVRISEDEVRLDVHPGGRTRIVFKAELFNMPPRLSINPVDRQEWFDVDELILAAEYVKSHEHTIITEMETI